MIVAAALILGGMIIVHEFGHFIVAKFFKVRVEAFSIGFGKRIWGWKKGDTDYKISLFPLGGYVKMAGENPEEELTGASDELMSKPKWQQFCIFVAGPAMNIVMALAIPAVLAMIHYEMPAYMNKPAVIGGVTPGGAADKAGLKTGDLIVDINGQANPTWSDLQDRIALNPDIQMSLAVKRSGEIQHLTLKPESRTEDNTQIGDGGVSPVLGPNAKLYVGGVNSGSQADKAGLKPGDQLLAFNGQPLEQDNAGSEMLIRGIQGSGGKPIKIQVKRNGQTVDIDATAQLDGGVYRLGFYSGASDPDILATRLSLPAALKYSYESNVHTIYLTKIALAQVFAGQRSATDTVAGPIQIFKFAGEAAKAGVGQVFLLMSLLSLNLGIFNLLPIPILDGGRIFILGLEAVLGLVGLPLSRGVKDRMMQAGFVVIVALMAFVIINDIRKVIPAKSEPPKVEAPAPAPNK